jgi:hypothetical protein
MIEIETIYKNTFGLLFSGFIVLLVFSWLLKREVSEFKFTQSNICDKFLFLLDNIYLIGGFCFGIILILLAFI